MNVSEYVWQRLVEWGLTRVYGYPGDGVGGLDVALEKARDTMQYVQVRHEEMAAFMASAHAKFTGRVGLCYATSGPGAIHLLTGLYDAKADHVPVVAIVGQQARSALGADYQQEVDLQNLFKDVAGDYVHMASVPGQVRQLIDRAVRIASTKRVVTCVILPNDLQLLDYKDPPLVHGTTHTGIGYASPAKLPDHSALQQAADVLNAGEKVAILVGAGALGATDEVIAVSGRLQAGCAKALLGQDSAARRPALGHRVARASRNKAKLGSDEGVRHIPHDRICLPLQRIPAKAGQRSWRADRHRRRAAQPPLSDGSQPGRR